ncbi:mitochondrial carrier protein [Skeletonema marinoi]|uniref:Mitochondrial carrier protein n=1 Tax=Skeletonema marinoi TaxID=267567 RepID=A0AAD8XYK9_9STRA|nr:mitochondrial carrier protein [Skeletonema marinoi]
MASESSWIDFTAGWISGGISTLAIQPVDTILTRMQANASIVVQPSTTSAAAGGANTVTTAAAATDVTATAVASLRPTNIFRGMISNFGISSLWRGSSAMIGAVPVQNAVLMTGYGYGKRWTDNDEEHNNNNVLLGVFIGGTIGGIFQSFVMSPIELIKVSQQVVGTSVSKATTSVVSGLLPSSNNNNSSAWRGLGATLLRDGIPHGVWFVSYEFAKVELTKMRNGSNNNNVMEGGGDSTADEIAIPMLSGAFAATTAWGVGYPFDLIKTRIQAGKSVGIVSTARDIVKESKDGRACYGLYRGFGLKLLRSIPASAIGFLTYETAAKALSSRG